MHEIAKRIVKAQNGDKDELAKLVEENQGLIWNIAKRFIGRGYDKEDIYQIGNMGLIKAIRKFDTEFEVQLSTYAVPYIMGEIKRFLRDDGPIKVSRSLKELYIKIIELQKEYEKKGEEISLLELSKILKVPKEEIVLAMESAKKTESLDESFYKDSKNDTKISVIEQVSTNIDEANMVVDKIAINRIIDNLSEREKQIILLRFYKDKTQVQVSRILGISQVQVSRLEKKILKNMKEELVV